MSLRTPLLLLALALSGLVATPALAVDDYPAYLKNAPIASLSDPWGQPNRVCSSFVAFRLNRDGTKLREPDLHYYKILAATQGSLADMQSAVDAAGARLDTTPEPGAMAVWLRGEDGVTGLHVAYIAEVYPDGTALVEEYNIDGDGLYHTEILRPPHVVHFPKGTLGSSPPPLASFISSAYGDSFGNIQLSVYLERPSSVQVTLRRAAKSFFFPARSFAAGDSDQELRVPAGWAKGPASVSVVVTPTDGTPALSFTKAISLPVSSNLGTGITSLTRRPGSLGVSYGLARRSLVSAQLRQGKSVVRLKARWVAAGRARTLRIVHPLSWAAKTATVTITVRASARAKPTVLRRNVRL